LILKFSGPDSWPLFRSYLPGYHPWYLTDEEAKYLTLCLWQAIDVSLRFKDDPRKLTPHMGNRYLVRVSKKDKTGLSWRDMWMEPLPLQKAEIIVEPVDEVRLEKIKRRIPYRQGVWEVDFFYYPEALREDKEERPYYSYITLWVDQHSGFILSYDLAKPAKCMSEFQGQFLKIAENRKILPREILVKKERLSNYLNLLPSELEINLTKGKKLKNVGRGPGEYEKVTKDHPLSPSNTSQDLLANYLTNLV